jgi:response regulator of citrate/malate metabolism
MMSSDGENDIVATCLADGAKDYLVKPVGYQHLKGLKEKVLSYQQPKKVAYESTSTMKKLITHMLET